MKTLTLLIILFSTQFLFAQPIGNENYIATIDLTTIVNDQVKVTIEVPRVQTESIIYCIPKIVPGTYSIYDFGRFISKFTAIDMQGNKMRFEPIDVNQYKIFNATQLNKIEYWVDDSYDMTMENPVFEPCGTNIQMDNFMINTFGFIGYLDGMKENDYSLKIEKPESFYGATPLIAKLKSAQTDTYYLNNYDQLADSPMMYAEADTAIKVVGDAEVLISVYAPNKMIHAKEIMHEVSEILEAQAAYLGGKLPVDKYAFLFYFTDTIGVSGSSGALEHMNSSVYFLPESPIEDIAPFLRDVCAHEFFHIVTPLNIHSTEIGDFNFIEPDMSKHLWLYEGQTEYAAHHAQVKAGLITTDEFLNRMYEKIETSQNYYNDTLAFTEMSLGCLDMYKNEYGNVYQKGALINMCLDIELRRLSNGKYGTQDLMRDLGMIYGKNKSFQDDELFSVITKMTYPEIGDFFNQYVEGNNSIPYDKYFNYVGISLSPVEFEKKISMGRISMNFNINPDSSEIIVQDLTGSNAFAKEVGYKVGDRIIQLGKYDLTKGNANQAIDIWKTEIKPGEKVIIYVERKMTNGKIKKKKLKGHALEVEVEKPRILGINENATKQQIQLRKDWIGF